MSVIAANDGLFAAICIYISTKFVEINRNTRYTEYKYREYFKIMYGMKYIKKRKIGISVGIKFKMYKKIYNLEESTKKHNVDTFKIKWYCFSIPFLRVKRGNFP